MLHMCGSACITRSQASTLCGDLRRTRAASASRICGLTEPMTRFVISSCSSKMSRKFAVVSLRPEVIAERGVDQLAGDAHPACRFAHASFKHVSHAELACDLAHVDRFVLVGKGGVARDHEEPLLLREPGDDVVGQAVGEIF